MPSASVGGTAALQKLTRTLRGLARVDSRAVFDERLHPAQDSRPSLGVTACRRQGAPANPVLANFQQRACAHFLRAAMLQSMNAARFQFPPDNGGLPVTVAWQSRYEPAGEAARLPDILHPRETMCHRRPRPRLTTCRPGRMSPCHSVMRYKPCCPHHCGTCRGSVMAWNTRSGGAAMKISPTTESSSGVTVTVAMRSSPVFFLCLFLVSTEDGRPRPSPIGYCNYFFRHRSNTSFISLPWLVKVHSSVWWLASTTEKTARRIWPSSRLARLVASTKIEGESFPVGRNGGLHARLVAWRRSSA